MYTCMHARNFFVMLRINNLRGPAFQSKLSLLTIEGLRSTQYGPFFMTRGMHCHEISLGVIEKQKSHACLILLVQLWKS